MQTVVVTFNDENGDAQRGELVNASTILEYNGQTVTVQIDRLRDDEVDVMTFDGGEMRFHRMHVSDLQSLAPVVVA